MSTDRFKEIRPYHDEEINAVLNRLINDPALINALVSFKLPRLQKILPALARILIKFYLKKYTKEINDIASLQLKTEKYIFKTIKDTTTSFTYEGLDKLDATQSYLFLSNHRDIVMDPTFVSFALHLSHFNTARIAAGDNLLSEQYIEDLMRLNKTFVVKRSITGKKEKLAAFMLLSEYISTSIEEGHSIWIAHREGRSKDGTDLTDTAVLKMLALGQRKHTKKFDEAIQNLKIVPVTISYQYDPCDEMKTHELVERALKGSYKKAANEDTKSIVKGIMGFKGDVKVSFGVPLELNESDDPCKVAESIDQKMRALFFLHDTNYAAYKLLKTYDASLPELPVPSSINTDEAEKNLNDRIQHLSLAEKTQLLRIYANAVLLKSS